MNQLIIAERYRKIQQCVFVNIYELTAIDALFHLRATVNYQLLYFSIKMFINTNRLIFFPIEAGFFKFTKYPA